MVMLDREIPLVERDLNIESSKRRLCDKIDKKGFDELDYNYNYFVNFKKFEDELKRLLQSNGETKKYKPFYCFTNKRRLHVYLKQLVKSHLVFIVQLINTGRYDEAKAELVLLINQTNAIEIENFTDILLYDFDFNNKTYLLNLKLLVAQILLKDAKCCCYLQSTDFIEHKLLMVFSNDNRFLTNEKFGKVEIKKVLSIIKILLNFYTILDDYRLLFGLKMLQYLNQYNLKFDAFIKNMTQGIFEKQLACTANEKSLRFLNSYYHGYSVFNRNPEKLMLSDISFTKEIDNKKNLVFTNNELVEQIDNLLLKFSEKKIDINEILEVFTIVQAQGFGKHKKILELVDQALNHINRSFNDSSNKKNSITTMLIISNYCYSISDVKRLSNAVIVLFNASVSYKNEELLLIASTYELKRFFLKNQYAWNDYESLITKFEKFLSVKTTTLITKLNVFTQIFNSHLLLPSATFNLQLSFVEKVFNSCFMKLKIGNYYNFEKASDTMEAILYSKFTHFSKVPVRYWSNLTKILYSNLTGNFEITEVDFNVNAKNTMDALYSHEILLKSAYLLNIEMSKHATKNLKYITDTYIERWTKKYDEQKNIDIYCRLESEFLKSLLSYLGLNNHYQSAITLCNTLKNYSVYNKVMLDIDKTLLQSLAGLKLYEEIEAFKIYFADVKIDFESIRLEKLITYLQIELEIISWDNDTARYNMITSKIEIFRKEVFDIRNPQKLPVNVYVKVLLFNIAHLLVASKLQNKRNNLVASIVDAKKCLNLSVSLIKKAHLLSESSRLTLTKFLLKAYINLVKRYTFLGISKESEFYVNELTAIISNLKQPSYVYEALSFMFEYYQIIDKKDLAAKALLKANMTFEFLDGNSDLYSTLMQCYQNNNNSKLEMVLSSFLGSNTTKSFLPQYWKLKLAQTINDNLLNKSFSLKNQLNNFNNEFCLFRSQMETDPLLKSLNDSVIALPSCIFPKTSPGDNVTNSSILSTKTDSPRSSSMTPKYRSLRQKFNRASAITALTNLKKSFEALPLNSMSVLELKKISYLQLLCESYLSNIRCEEYGGHNLKYQFTFNDLHKSLPYLYEQKLELIDSNIYDSCSPTVTIELDDTMPVDDELAAKLNTELKKSDMNFAIIAIDICPETGHLLLSKTVPEAESIFLRLPLNRANSRDPDILNVNFDQAYAELKNIIEKSNYSTSREVTIQIKTREERKQWWKLRYDLDDKLRKLLETIENSWFGGFQGLFKTDIKEDAHFLNFESNFYKTLHQVLPTRKQFGNPSMFIKIEKWILKLFLHLDPKSDNFLNMLEDLMYFVLDILLFHGEENAYDELDVNFLFISLEEIIEKYQRNFMNSDKNNIHTFLIVNEKCHFFPWESLKFLNGHSISRVPNRSSLNSILNGRNTPNLKIPLEKKLSVILNPNGDLTRTEEFFKKRFENLVSSIPHSTMLANRIPKEHEFLDILQNSSLSIYIGHGSGQQYVKDKSVKKCGKISPSLLLGCSSAAISLYGPLSARGTIYSYLQGGCQSILGNLWDVTDKDIDKFSEKLFLLMGIFKDESVLYEKISDSELSEAVSASRNACHLKYLNGAAPVVFGLPTYFDFKNE